MSVPPGKAKILSSEQRATTLGRILRERRIAGAKSGHSIQPRAVKGPAPLSFSQQRLWFISRMEPENPFYNIPTAFRIKGPLDSESLRKALMAVGRRHESLRTLYTENAGEPVQEIAESCVLEFAAVDLSERPEHERIVEAQKLLFQEARRPFDLSRDFPYRTALFRLAPEDHILLVVEHHIASDAWSRDILFREISIYYESYSGGEASVLPDLPIQYADFAVWQRNRFQETLLEEHLKYWEERLAGSLPLLQLPTDRSRPPVQAFRGARESFLVSKGLVDSLQAFSGQEKCTLFMTLLALFNTLLYRYTGQQDIVIGSPVAGRNWIETENLIGCFINNVALRTDLSGNPTFRELLARVREACVDAYAHQDLPFEELIERVQPKRNLSYSPVFQVMFVLHSGPSQGLELRGLDVTPMEVHTATSKFDLTLSMTATGGGLSGDIDYDIDLFEASTIERTIGHFKTLLESIVDNPDRKLSELSILTPPELRQLTVEWNNTKTEYPKNSCIHLLFEAQVERTPDAVAVVFEDRKLTYRELNARANQVAHYLIKRGVEPDVLVGICIERSLEMIVGLLGILKAGGAYVPLDPAYPKERIAFMLDDAHVKVLLTDQNLVNSFRTTKIECICLDADWPVISQETPQCVLSTVTPHNLSYVIYTSGSTGKPKGVAIEHRNTVAFLNWCRSIFAEPELTGVLAGTSICFDISVFELFLPLISGGQTILVQNTLELPVLPQSNEITLINTVPSVMAELLGNDGLPASVRTVNLAGEPVPQQLVDRLYEHTSVQRIYDLYGPTEATTYSTFALRTRGGRQTIGRPIANTVLYILDKEMQPVPIGIPGELYLGGDGLTRGYLNRPELTADKFIPNPFSNEPGARLYKTGDLGRFLPDGNVEFLGRIDHQVKIRGFRIELGEIETTLEQHPNVRSAVVTAREDAPGDRRLAAYIVTNSETRAPSLSELRTFLRQKLPEYMIPSNFVFLDSMPLGPGGKVDRHRLPFPDQASLKGRHVAPRTHVEKRLAGIWAEVLGVGGIGIHDDFFELGGHSLLATRVISKVRKLFQMEFPLRRLFESPTVEGMAELIQSHFDQPSSLPVLTRVAGVKRAPLSFAQQRLWFLDQWEPLNSFYNVPTILRITGALDLRALEQGLNEIVRRHEVLRTTFSEEQDQPIQRITGEIDLRLPVTDLGQLPDEERDAEARRRAFEETARPFDLVRGPLIRAALFRLSEQEHLLAITMHHIITDGWSLGVFFRELSILYEAFSSGKQSPLPDLSIQYTDFAVSQRQWLQGEILERELNYWKEQLQNLAVLELPTDRARPPLMNYRGNRKSFTVDPFLLQSLKRLSRREGVTLFMTLLAAFQSLLHRYSGQEDIAVGAPIAGRNRVELEDLIGFFVNTLVMRIRLGGDPSFREMLGRVRETALGAYAHQNLPFEKVVDELNPERDPSRNPLFQVMLVLQNTPDPEPTLPSLIIEQLPVQTTTAKLDLLLSLTEKPEGLSGTFEYGTDLFDGSTIERMIGNFQTLLQGIIANPDQKISELPLLTPAERHKLLVEWNNTKTDYPKHACIHELFEAQVEQTPDAVAAQFENGTLTYRELNMRANRLAHYLQNRGMGAEALVGLCIDRSLEMVIGILGILKAGAAYVPLDPSFPHERLAYMLEHAKVQGLVTQAHLVSHLPPHAGQTVLIDADGAAISECMSVNTSRDITAESLAYVLFTSGSTGRPKAVAMPHRPLINLISWHQSEPRLREPARTLQFAPIAFDVSFQDLVATLCTGGTVVLISDDIRRDPAALLNFLEAQRIERLYVSFVALEQLSEAYCSKPHDLAHLRDIVSAGEALCLTAEIRKFLGHLGECRLHNHYGPTECHVVTSETMSADPTSWPKEAPIGHPISNVRLYVLDRKLQPVPAGVAGELYIGGDCLSRGYLNDPELTEERFIFSHSRNERLYKTGDLARFMADGRLEFLGRLDEQVKIRGFRVEPGEIESILREHPEVKNAAVVALENTPGDKRLVAYVVAENRQAAHAATLRSYLQRKLPEYMVPAAFLFLETLPLNSNGKVDRRALPAPELTRSELLESYVAPRTQIEETLAAIWAEVLGAKKIGVHDSFFELGGHSLLAARVVSSIRRSFHIDIPLRRLFETPTIAGLAEYLDRVAEILAELERMPDEEGGKGT